MSAYRVLNYKEFELDNNITYGLPMKQDMYYLAMNKKLDRYFQTPKLKALTGICLDEFGNHYIDMSIENKDSFDYFIQKLDEFNILSLFENCTTWFNDNFKYSVINNLYINSRFRRKNHSENSVRLYFSKNEENQLSINIFNEGKGKLTIDDIMPNYEYNAIIRINCLKISKKNVSCILELVQLKYFEKTINLINSIQTKNLHKHKTGGVSNSAFVTHSKPIGNKKATGNKKEVDIKEVDIKEVDIKEVGVKEVGVKEVDIKEVGVKEVGVKEVGVKEVGVKENRIKKSRVKDKTDKIIKIDTKNAALKKRAKKAFIEAEKASKEADTLRLKAIKAASMAKQYGK